MMFPDCVSLQGCQGSQIGSLMKRSDQFLVQVNKNSKKRKNIKMSVKMKPNVQFKTCLLLHLRLMHKWIDSLSSLSFTFFISPEHAVPPFLPLIETYPGIVCPSNFQGWLQHFPCLCCAFRLLVQHSVHHPFAKTFPDFLPWKLFTWHQHPVVD